MTYIAYLTVKYYHRKKLNEHVNPCYVAANILMIAANILIGYIYATHPMDVVIQNSWNPDMNLTLFSPYFFHAYIDFFFALGLILIHFDKSITVLTIVTQ